MYTYLTNISSILSSDIEVKDFADSLSRTQHTSKKWLVDTLVAQQFKQNPTILILGGWYGSYLIPMLIDSLKPSKIHFNDINQKCLEVAQKLHRSSILEYHCFDATNQMLECNADIVINTSCEHMQTYHKMLNSNKGCLFVLQTCDNQNDPGHVNVSASTEEFKEKLGLSRVFFAGRRALGHKNRFMVIGQK